MLKQLGKYLYVELLSLSWQKHTQFLNQLVAKKDKRIYTKNGNRLTHILVTVLYKNVLSSHKTPLVRKFMSLII